jgi:hypothetical protein
MADNRHRDHVALAIEHQLLLALMDPFFCLYKVGKNTILASNKQVECVAPCLAVGPESERSVVRFPVHSLSLGNICIYIASGHQAVMGTWWNEN